MEGLEEEEKRQGWLLTGKIFCHLQAEYLPFQIQQLRS